jgi:hypothetical protein
MVYIVKLEVAEKERQVLRVAPSCGNLSISIDTGDLGNETYKLVSSNLSGFRKRPKPINKPWCRSTM